jgi:hypothetical protein
LSVIIDIRKRSAWLQLDHDPVRLFR